MQEEQHKKSFMPHSKQEEFEKGVWWQPFEKGFLINGIKLKHLKVNTNWTLTTSLSVWVGAEQNYSPRAADAI